MAVVRIIALFTCLAASACGNRQDFPQPARDATLDQKLTPVPEPFRNVWAVNLDDCLHADGKTRLSIDPASISFPEARFDVVGINQPDKDKLLIDVRLAGGPLQTHVLSVSDAMSTLNYAGPGIMQTYHRCDA
ncbi:MAG: hypothetical protein EON93_11475 [Burkholderiales bacterium]|nr:MAG: hypothetical protein EON93_11475 [Burkholderiales bacterium]